MNNPWKVLTVVTVFCQLIFLQSCHEVREFEVTRIIKNDSDFEVIIEGYFDSGNEIDRFNLDSGDSLFDSEICTYKEVGRSSCTIATFSYDSLKLFYNNERSELFCSGLYPDCINLEKDIMEFNPFAENGELTGGYVESPENTFTYRITNEDYDRAEPIGD